MMPKDYEAAAKQIAAHHGAIGESTGRDIALEVARACYALHCKPQRELTRDEKYAIWLSVWTGKFDTALCQNGSEVVDKIIAAYIRKQQEPETVKFRAARVIGDEASIAVLRADMLPCGWEWLPGEPQEYEVTLP